MTPVRGGDFAALRVSRRVVRPPDTSNVSYNAYHEVVWDRLDIVCSPGCGGGEGAVPVASAKSAGERRGGDCESCDIVEDGRAYDRRR